ncbi:MAG: hypothetical protein HYU36_01705 [Planctomycetes bacterium]|nr:hypothetical protein [Planctomycetota bacterium]
MGYAVVAVQPFGHGRTMAFTADSTWQWYLQLRGLGQESPFVRFWVQACRWLAGRKAEDWPLEAGLRAHLLEEEVQAGQVAVLCAQVNDAQGLPTPLANVTATLAGPGGQTFHVTLPFAPDRADPYEASFEPPVPGDYSAEVKADLEGQPIGEPVRLTLRVGRPSRELEEINLNENLLARLAKGCGGQYVRLPQLSDLASVLSGIEVRHRTARHYVLWNAPWLFIVFVVLQTAEWVLRRRKHLA